MPETTNSQPQENNRENPLKKERLENLSKMFNEAETVLSAEGRERAKEYLPGIYDELIELNKRNKEEWQTIWVWNPEGDLTEQEFNDLNLRRKLLSNAIGIMTASGIVRHDLNEL